MTNIKPVEEIVGEFEKSYGRMEIYYHADGAYVPEGKYAIDWLRTTIDSIHAAYAARDAEVVEAIEKLRDKEVERCKEGRATLYNAAITDILAILNEKNV